MITKVNNGISTLKNLFLEVLIDQTSKISNVADGSVVNAIAFGVGKVAQKAIKDIAIVEAQLFPEYATGDYLDKSAALFGVSPRKNALGSSTYVRVYAEPGTRYAVGSTFISKSGVRFETDEALTVNESGYGYVHVRSTITGLASNVEANSIVQISPRPLGHIECTNEYYAIGGRDYEDDETFRKRIRNNGNRYSQGTMEYWTQVFQEADDRVLKVMNVGLGEDGNTYIYLVTQNGVLFTEDELSVLLEKVKSKFSISEIDLNGDVIGIRLRNAKWMIVGGETGIDFRVELSSKYQTAEVRRNIQVALTKYLDFRFWDAGKTVQWDDLLSVVKNAEGVKYVPDEYFSPRYDMEVPINQLPRIQGFRMRNLQGNILYDSNQTLSSYFYPASEGDKIVSQIGTGITYLASFKVVNTRNNPVPDATISIGNSVITTDSKGTANILLENGEYNYTLTKMNWVTRTGQFVILNQPVYITINDFYAIPYNVTFKVITGLNPVDGALITINGEEHTTGPDGTAVVSLEPGSYAYTIEKVNYQTITNGLSVLNQDILIEEEMFVETMKVNFAAIDRMNQIFVPDAVISVRNMTTKTDLEGQASMPLQIGSYELDAVRDGYLPFHREFDVDARIDNCVLLEMESTPYQITFTVIDIETNKVIPNASLQVNNQTYLTDESGQTIVSLVSGTWDFVVFKSGYLKYNGTVVVDGASKSVLVQLSVAYYNYYLVFRDIDTGDYLQGVQVTIRGKIYISDVNGQIVATLPNGSYDYIARRANYKDKLGTITVQDQDDKEIVYMEVRDSINTITVLDYLSNNPIEGASVKVYNKGTGEMIQELFSLSNGVCQFSAHSGEYYLIASHPDYIDTPQLDFTLERLKDMTMNVLMDRRTKTSIFEIDEIVPKTSSSLDSDEEAATANPITNGISIKVTGLQWMSTNKFETATKTYAISANGQVTVDILPLAEYTIEFVDKGFYNQDSTKHSWKMDVATDFFRWTVTCIKTLTLNVLQKNSNLPIEVENGPEEYPEIAVTGQSRPQRIWVDALGASTFYVSPGTLDTVTTQVDHITQNNELTFTTPPTVAKTIYLDYPELTWKMDIDADFPVSTKAVGLIVDIHRQLVPEYVFTGITDADGQFESDGKPEMYPLAPGYYVYEWGSDGNDSDWKSNTERIYFPVGHQKPTKFITDTALRKVTENKGWTLVRRYAVRDGIAPQVESPLPANIPFDIYADNQLLLSNQKVNAQGQISFDTFAGVRYKFQFKENYNIFYAEIAHVVLPNELTGGNLQIVTTPLISHAIAYNNVIYPSQAINTVQNLTVELDTSNAALKQSAATATLPKDIWLSPNEMRLTGELKYFTNTPNVFNPYDHIGEEDVERIKLDFTAKQYNIPVKLTESITGGIAANCPITIVSKWNPGIKYTATTGSNGTVTIPNVYYGDYTYTLGGNAVYKQKTGEVSFPVNGVESPLATWTNSVTYNTGDVTVNMKWQYREGLVVNLNGGSFSFQQGDGEAKTFTTDASGNATISVVIGLPANFTYKNNNNLIATNPTFSHTFGAVGESYSYTLISKVYTQKIIVTEKNTGDKADDCHVILTHQLNSSIKFDVRTGTDGTVTIQNVPSGPYNWTAGENVTYDSVSGTTVIPIGGGATSNDLNIQVVYNTGQVSLEIWTKIPGFGDQTNGKIQPGLAVTVTQAGKQLFSGVINEQGKVFFTASLEVPVTFELPDSAEIWTGSIPAHTYHAIGENYKVLLTRKTGTATITVNNSTTGGKAASCPTSMSQTLNGVTVSFSGTTNASGVWTVPNVPLSGGNYVVKAGGNNIFTSASGNMPSRTTSMSITLSVAYQQATFNVTVREIVPGFGDQTNGQLLGGLGSFNVTQNGATKQYTANGSGVLTIQGYVGLAFSIQIPYSGNYSNGTQSWTPANTGSSATLKFTISKKVRLTFTNSIFGQNVTGVTVSATGATATQTYNSSGNNYVDVYVGARQISATASRADYNNKETAISQTSGNLGVAMEPVKYNVTITVKDGTWTDWVQSINGATVKLTSTRKNTVTYSGTTNASGQVVLNVYKTSPYTVNTSATNFTAASGTLEENATALTINMKRISFNKTVTVQVGGKNITNTAVEMMCCENHKILFNSNTNGSAQFTATYYQGLHYISRIKPWSTAFTAGGITSQNYQEIRFTIQNGWNNGSAISTVWWNGTQKFSHTPDGITSGNRLICTLRVKVSDGSVTYHETRDTATWVNWIKANLTTGGYIAIVHTVCYKTQGFALNASEANSIVNMGNFGQCSIPGWWTLGGRYVFVLTNSLSGSGQNTGWMDLDLTNGTVGTYIRKGSVSPFTENNNTGVWGYNPTTSDTAAYTWNINPGTINANGGTYPYNHLKCIDGFNSGILSGATGVATYSMGYQTQTTGSLADNGECWGKMLPGNVSWSVSKSGYLSASKGAVGLWTSRYQEITLARQGMFVKMTFRDTAQNTTAPAGVAVQITGTDENGASIGTINLTTDASGSVTYNAKRLKQGSTVTWKFNYNYATVGWFDSTGSFTLPTSIPSGGTYAVTLSVDRIGDGTPWVEERRFKTDSIWATGLSSLSECTSVYPVQDIYRRNICAIGPAPFGTRASSAYNPTPCLIFAYLMISKFGSGSSSAWLYDLCELSSQLAFDPNIFTLYYNPTGSPITRPQVIVAGNSVNMMCSWNLTTFIYTAVSYSDNTSYSFTSIFGFHIYYHTNPSYFIFATRNNSITMQGDIDHTAWPAYHAGVMHQNFFTTTATNRSGYAFAHEYYFIAEYNSNMFAKFYVAYGSFQTMNYADIGSTNSIVASSNVYRFGKALTSSYKFYMSPCNYFTNTSLFIAEAIMYNGKDYSFLESVIRNRDMFQSVIFYNILKTQTVSGMYIHQYFFDNLYGIYTTLTKPVSGITGSGANALLGLQLCHPFQPDNTMTTLNQYITSDCNDCIEYYNTGTLVSGNVYNNYIFAHNFTGNKPNFYLFLTLTEFKKDVYINNYSVWQIGSMGVTDLSSQSPWNTLLSGYGNFKSVWRVQANSDFSKILIYMINLNNSQRIGLAKNPEGGEIIVYSSSNYCTLDGIIAVQKVSGGTYKVISNLNMIGWTDAMRNKIIGKPVACMGFTSRRPASFVSASNPNGDVDSSKIVDDDERKRLIEQFSVPEKHAVVINHTLSVVNNIYLKQSAVNRDSGADLMTEFIIKF